MTDDQQFVIAVVTICLPVAASILTYRKTEQTHQAVNGLQAKKVRAARASGARSAISNLAATDLTVTPAKHAPPKPQTHVLLQDSSGYGKLP